MGLFDFMKGKQAWKSANEKKALEAVESINGWSELLDIIKNAPNKNVRIPAIKKLHLPLMNLSDICQINDQNLLKEIYFNNNYQDLQVAVINQIKDQSILADIAKIILDNESVLRNTVLAKLTVQTALTDVVMNAHSIEMRKEVIKHKVNDLSTLIHVAKHNDSEEIKKNVIRLISDENTIVELVEYYISNNSSVEILKSAIERLEQFRKEKENSNFTFSDIVDEARKNCGIKCGDCGETSCWNCDILIDTEVRRLVKYYNQKYGTNFKIL